MRVLTAIPSIGSGQRNVRDRKICSSNVDGDRQDVSAIQGAGSVADRVLTGTT